MTNDPSARDMARDAARRATALALGGLPIFLRTSPMEVLAGIAVVVLGILDGGLTGALLVGIGTLLVSWTTATGIAAARATAAARAAHEAHLAELANRLLPVRELLEQAATHEQAAVRDAFGAQARRELDAVVGEIAPETVHPTIDEPPAPPAELPALTPNGASSEEAAAGEQAAAKQ